MNIHVLWVGLMAGSVLLGNQALAQENAVPLPTPEVKFQVEGHDKEKTSTVVATSVNIFCEDQVCLDKDFENPLSFLVVEQVKSTTRLQSDAGDDYSLKATAYMGNKDYPKKRVWSMEDTAARGELQYYFFHTIEPVQGESMPTHRYYSLKTGKMLYVGNCEIAGMAGKVHRFVTFQRQFLKDDERPHEAGPTNLAGVLFFGDNDRVLRKFMITGKDEDGILDEPTVEFDVQGAVSTNGNLIEDTKADASRCEVRVAFENVVLKIPCDESGPLLAEVRNWPKGFAIQELKD